MRFSHLQLKSLVSDHKFFLLSFLLLPAIMNFIAMWQIKYQNEFFDLQPNQNTEIERNSPLFLVDNLLQEVSTPFTLAYSDKNSKLIGHIFFEQTRKAKTKIPVEVYY